MTAGATCEDPEGSLGACMVTGNVLRATSCEQIARRRLQIWVGRSWWLRRIILIVYVKFPSKMLRCNLQLPASASAWAVLHRENATLQVLPSHSHNFPQSVFFFFSTPRSVDAGSCHDLHKVSLALRDPAFSGTIGSEKNKTPVPLCCYSERVDSSIDDLSQTAALRAFSRSSSI